MALIVRAYSRDWEFSSPGPAVALRIHELAGMSPNDQYLEIVDIVVEHLSDDDAVWFDARGKYELPEDAPAELLIEWLEAATGKPFSAVAALSSALVESWAQVRGRLITSGIPEPMVQIRQLGSMLDAVEFMILESHKDDKERARYRQKVYKPRVKTGAIEKPAGSDPSDMAAQAAMLEALDA